MICITEAQLRAAMTDWEQAARNAGRVWYIESAHKSFDLPVEQVGSENAGYVLDLLKKHGAKQTID